MDVEHEDHWRRLRTVKDQFITDLNPHAGFPPQLHSTETGLGLRKGPVRGTAQFEDSTTMSGPSARAPSAGGETLSFVQASPRFPLMLVLEAALVERQQTSRQRGGQQGSPDSLPGRC